MYLYFCNVKAKTVIGVAALAYLVYDKMQQTEALEELKKKIQSNEDSYNAQFNQLANDMESAIADNKGYVDKDVTATVRIELSSIDDKYWCMAGWVTLKNESPDKKLVSGLNLSWEYKGNVCEWQLWEQGTYTLPANSSVTIRLHSVNTKVLFSNKNSREAIKNAFRSVTGKKKSLVSSVGASLPITANLMVLQTIYGHTKQHIFVFENISGTCKYASYGICFSYASNKNGNSISDFKQ